MGNVNINKHTFHYSSHFSSRQFTYHIPIIIPKQITCIQGNHITHNVTRNATMWLNACGTQCESNVSPLSDSMFRIQATLPIRTRSKPIRLSPIKDHVFYAYFQLRINVSYHVNPSFTASTIKPTMLWMYVQIPTNYAIKIISSILTHRITP